MSKAKKIGIGIGIFFAGIIFAAIVLTVMNEGGLEENTAVSQTPSTKVQTDLKSLFPTREQVGTTYTISDLRIIEDSKSGIVYYKKGEYGKQHWIKITKFGTVQEATNHFEEISEQSYNAGGFSYFDVDVKNAQCYGEHRSFEFDVFCVKKNIYYTLSYSGSVSGYQSFADRLVTFAQYVADSFE